MATTTVTPSELGYSPQIAVSKTCFAHHHLTMEEYGLWTHASQLAHESGIFYFDGRKIANRFAETKKDAVYRVGRNLIRKGWFLIVRKPKRLRNGMFSPGQYRPVSHAEWVAEHPGTCLEIQTGTQSASLENQNDLSGNPERPVWKSRHNMKGLNIKGECKGDETLAASRVQGLHTPNLDSHTMERDEDEIKPDQTAVPDHQNKNQSSPPSAPSPRVDSKSAAYPAPYGSTAWWDARRANMSDEDLVLAAIASIKIANERRFDCNNRVRQIVRDYLARGVPTTDIVEAAADFASTLPEKDKMPGVALAQNLSQTIDVRAWRKVQDAKKQERREQDRLQTERLKREMEAQPRHEPPSSAPRTL